MFSSSVCLQLRAVKKTCVGLVQARPGQDPEHGLRVGQVRADSSGAGRTGNPAAGETGVLPARGHQLFHPGAAEDPGSADDQSVAHLGLCRSHRLSLCPAARGIRPVPAMLSLPRFPH